MDLFISHSVSYWTTTDAASGTTHDRKTSMFDFLFTSYDGLSAVEVVSGQCFLAGDVTHIVNCKQEHVLFVMSLSSDTARIYLCEHFNRQKYVVV